MRTQKSEVRSQKSEIRNQKSEVEYRGADVQIYTKSGGRQICRRGKAYAQERPRTSGYDLWEHLCCQGGDGCEYEPDGKGLCRG